MTKSYSPRTSKFAGGSVAPKDHDKANAKAKAIANPNDGSAAFSAACRKLSTRMRTEKEIADYLKSLDFAEEVIAEALTELRDYGYINDKKYAFEYFKYARRKGWAMQRIRHELANKGIGADIIEEVKYEIEQARDENAAVQVTAADAGEFDAKGGFGGFGGFTEELPELDDATVARSVAQKMAKNQLADGKELDEKFMARLARRLAGLGYTSSVIYGVSKEIREYEREQDTDTEG